MSKMRNFELYSFELYSTKYIVKFKYFGMQPFVFNNVD